MRQRVEELLQLRLQRVVAPSLALILKEPWPSLAAEQAVGADRKRRAQH
jgi:hypothetical protein